MNPTSASLPAAPRQIVNDVGRPTPASMPNPAAPQAAINVVANIPVHNPGVPVAAPLNEDAELDKIMQDVGHEMKKDDTPHKRGLLSFLHKAKPTPPAVKQIVNQATASAPRPVPATQAPMTAAAPAPRPNAQPHGQAAKSPGAVKAKNPKAVPVFVIFVAVLVTGFLVVAAVAAYKQ